MSRSPQDLWRVLLPCGQSEFPHYSVEGGAIFKAYNLMCCRNRCPKKTLTNRIGACHWTNIFGSDCLAEATEDKLTWNKWVQRSRSSSEQHDEQGKQKTFTTDEWAPYDGTRSEFLGELRAALESGGNPYFYHLQRHRYIRHAIRLHESRKDGHTATELADYAAVLDTPREKTSTCSVPERSNELVVAMGYKPYTQEVQIPSRGKRLASIKHVRKQHVDVFFAFHPSGYKPNARSYNTAAEDIDCFLKYGRVRHGEWFHQGQRLQGGNHSRPLPEGFSERPIQPADFPEYSRKLSIKDGCAMQFDGKDNYHQVSEWGGKTAPTEEDRQQAYRLVEAKLQSIFGTREPSASTHVGQRCAPSNSNECLTTGQQVEEECRRALFGDVEKSLAFNFGVGRVDWKLETMHGKNVCDSLSNMPKRTLEGAIERGDLLLTGTREKVIYLARHRASPDSAKLWKEGWWTVDRIFYGFYDHKEFTSLNVPTAVGFKDSHECHLFAGLGKDVDASRLMGPLSVRGNVCACKACTAGNFDGCEMKLIFGDVRHVKAPRAQSELSGLHQLQSLHLFAAACKKGQLLATRVASDEACLEGLYYLVLLCAHILPQA